MHLANGIRRVLN